MYVHLAKDIESAHNVAIRKTKTPIIIKVKSLEASKKGSSFFLEGEVFLCEYVSPDYLEITY
jgi:RNA:NAD 2'-phosphotransferase (TPT1/KptA family)